MKTINKTVFFGIAFLFSIVKTYGNKSTDTLLCLEISGHITHLKAIKNDFYKVKLVYNGCTLDSVNVKDKGEFKFRLKKNTVYGILLTKPGYVSRIISVDTNLPDSAEGLFRFDFDTEMIELGRTDKLNKDALDFPIAVICYHEELNYFYYNEQYTSCIKRRIFLREL
ncbi:MAG: hypothetical protein H0W61_06510 [Bacteroidetes bacterium]|nr:hypothetical protein [Bacteroidota bacterium]